MSRWDEYRRSQVIVLLRWYRDATSTLPRGESVGHLPPDSRLLRMSSLYWRGSFQALERCLRDLRRDDPRAYVAVTDRYVDIEIKTRNVRRLSDIAANERLVDHGHRPVWDNRGNHSEPLWVRVERWPEGVDLAAADRGLTYLARRMPRAIRVPMAGGGTKNGAPNKREPLAA